MKNEVSPELSALLSAVANMADAPQHPHPRKGDRRDGSVYSPTPEIITAVQVALITGRPLLLAGPPGCGKSSLAGFVARTLGFDYFEFVVDDEASPQDLLWHVDVIARLRDAQLAVTGERVPPINDYIEPGRLWWALDPDSAARRGAGEDAPANRPCSKPVDLDEGYEPQRAGAVLLIDEIDKAESSFCNGLLVPLGSRQFTVLDINRRVENGPGRAPESPLVIVTTNGERDLPDAFVRRCVVLSVEGPGAERLEAIAKLHFPEISGDVDLVERVQELAHRFAKNAKEHASTAEFLDLVSVMLTLGADSDAEQWKLVERLVVEKPSVRKNLFASW